MTEKEFFQFFSQLDDDVLKLIAKDTHEKGQEHYNELIMDGWSPDEAMYEVLIKTSYRSMKYAVMAALYFFYNVDPVSPKSKEELKKFFTLIK